MSVDPDPVGVAGLECFGSVRGSQDRAVAFSLLQFLDGREDLILAPGDDLAVGVVQDVAGDGGHGVFVEAAGFLLFARHGEPWELVGGTAGFGATESAADLATIMPARVEPVNETISTSGCAEMAEPTPGPSP